MCDCITDSKSMYKLAIYLMDFLPPLFFFLEIALPAENEIHVGI